MQHGSATGRPACFLDRDGVLNVDVGYPHRPDQLELTPTAGRAVRRLNDAGFLVVVVTNQSGVARGLFSMADVELFHDAMRHRLADHGARIDAFYVAPYHPAGTVAPFAIDHPDRKPGAGLLTRAMTDLAIDAAASFLIGDKDSDLEAGRRVGVRSMLIKSDDGDLDSVVAALLQMPSGSSPALTSS